MKVKIVVMLAFIVLSSAGSVLCFAQTQEGMLPDAPDQKADNLRFMYLASRISLLGGGMLDETSTYRLMSHPTVAYRADGTVLMRYHGVEAGWARCFGARNRFAAVSANAGLNAGVEFLSGKIYRRGGRWRMLAIAINAAKTADDVLAGVHNVRFNGSVDEKVRLATGYNGRIIWSK